MRKHPVRFIFLFCLIFFLINLAVLPHYGLTWDFHHQFFAGLRVFTIPIEEYTKHIPFGYPDPRIMQLLPFGQIINVFPAAAVLFFHKALGLLPFDVAGNLPAVLFGTLGIGVLFFFLLKSLGPETALFGSVILALYPRYFYDLHNNTKDIPSAAMFAFAVTTLFFFAQKRSVLQLAFAALGFALAFNTKVNAVTIPVVAGIWFAWILGTSLRKRLDLPIQKISFKRLVPFFLYFVAAGGTAFGLWSLFWDDPVKRLFDIPVFFQSNTFNMEVLFNGTFFCSGVTVPWYYAPVYLAIVTPLPVLFFFLIGSVWAIANLGKKPVASLLLLWLTIPLLRYLFIEVGVIDGIRHFEEVVFPLCALAGIGATLFLRFIERIVHRVMGLQTIFIIFTLLLFLTLLVPIIRYHPYQIAYFNELVGGIRGASGKYDLDYWASSQKDAVEWINRTASPNATVIFAMAGDTASRYLRPDILAASDKPANAYDLADYTIVLNRPSFFYKINVADYILTHEVIHTIENQGVPLVFIFDNRKGTVPRKEKFWQGEDNCTYTK